MHGPRFVDVGAERVEEVADETLDYLRVATRGGDLQTAIGGGPHSLDRDAVPFEVVGAGTFRIRDSWRRAASDLSIQADEAFRTVIADAPVLELVAAAELPALSPSDLFTWALHDPRGLVPVEDASDALRRWALVSIRLALDEAWRRQSGESDTGYAQLRMRGQRSSSSTSPNAPCTAESRCGSGSRWSRRW